MLRLIPLALLLSAARPRRLRLGRRRGAASTTAATETEATQPVRVGLIVDQGQLDDNGFNELAFSGVTRAEDELGIEGRVVESATVGRLHPEHDARWPAAATTS